MSSEVCVLGKNFLSLSCACVLVVLGCVYAHFYTFLVSTQQAVGGGSIYCNGRHYVVCSFVYYVTRVNTRTVRCFLGVVVPLALSAL